MHALPRSPLHPKVTSKIDFQLAQMFNSWPVLQVSLVHSPSDSAEYELQHQLLTQEEFILRVSKRNISLARGAPILPPSFLPLMEPGPLRSSSTPLPHSWFVVPCPHCATLLPEM